MFVLRMIPMRVHTKYGVSKFWKRLTHFDSANKIESDVDKAQTKYQVRYLIASCPY